jgi:hypothetical protein
MWNGTIGLPVAFASQIAPGCATFAGPRGPSSVNAAGFPPPCRASAAAAPCARRVSTSPARAVAEALDDAGDPLAVEILAVMTTIAPAKRNYVEGKIRPCQNAMIGCRPLRLTASR